MYVSKAKNKNNLIAISIFICCLLSGFLFAKFYQPQSKTERIYKQALKDFENGNFSNSYFQFSKVSYLSPLKPIAIYRQALCAKALGDKTSEIKRYQEFLQYYSSHNFAPEIQYQAGQLIVESNPDLAQKYFTSVLKSNLDEDYKIASKYYLAKIETFKYTNSKNLSLQKIKEIESSFREYLEKHPDGRLAISVANTWENFSENISSKDLVLIAEAYLSANQIHEAAEALSKSKLNDNWAILSLYSTAIKDSENTKLLVSEGVSKYSQDIPNKTYIKAVDNYIKNSKDDKYKAIEELLTIANGKGKDYLWNLKCEFSPNSIQASCYKDFYLSNSNSEYAENALYTIFNDAILKKDYNQANTYAQSFIEKFPKSDYYPRVMFWYGKIAQKHRYSPNYPQYYKTIINNYPDSYYAYRAFWLLNGVKNSTINAVLNFKPVEFPYKYPSKNDILYTLLEVQDYDMLIKYTQDEFIKSWVEHQRGNYPKSMIIARDAMSKMDNKPGKNDLRWRLVYPQNYFKQVQSYAAKYHNNDALMMSIIREESSFNSEAQSGVGAMGLMQLMPSTAHEIGDKHSIDFNTNYLFNPDLNIKLGNLYYSTIKEILEGKDVSAIAAYNGGIGSVTKWKTSLSYNDTDEFIEQIPYPETKNYVFKVFRSYWNYSRIYQK